MSKFSIDPEDISVFSGKLSVGKESANSQVWANAMFSVLEFGDPKEQMRFFELTVVERRRVLQVDLDTANRK